ncbi:hypothetical protein JNK62_03515 [bacterium]|nr:hypothetical protein [bacterium]
MRTIFLGVGMFGVAAFAIAFSPKMHLSMGDPVLTANGLRVPQPREKRGPRMPTRCPKSERMARQRQTDRRDAVLRYS